MPNPVDDLDGFLGSLGLQQSNANQNAGDSGSGKLSADTVLIDDGDLDADAMDLGIETNQGVNDNNVNTQNQTSGNDFDFANFFGDNGIDFDQLLSQGQQNQDVA